MQDLLSHLDKKYFGNALSDWLLAAALFVVIFLAVEFVRGLVRARQQRWQRAGSAPLELFGGFAAATSRLVVLSVALYFSEKLLRLPPRADRLFDVVIVAGITVQLALWATTTLRFTIERHYRSAAGGEAGPGAAVGVLMFVGGVVIWAVFALLALDNLGVNITALVAGLGVGGIAVALAVQAILGDLFASISIALDKPFVVGDQLRVDDIEGIIEHIGIKSTRLRSLSGEQVILANADLLKSRLRNLGRMPERRVLFRVGVTYETPPEKLDQVSGIIRRAVEAVPHTRFLQCPLMSLGADSLEFELIFFVANRPGVGWGLVVGEVNRGIFGAFGAAGINFAYPTRRLLVEQSAPAKP